ncbi:MAG: hypothetical protein JW747_10090 [Candidatus Aminicenantes bacterium]|nr:hypothetical protein [Candidatus Aminicenantes bacterium]
MDLSSDELRYRLRQGDPTPPCPPAEILAAALSGKIKGARRDRLIDHLVRCGECTREVRMLCEIDARLAPLLKRAVSEDRQARFRRPALKPIWAAGAFVLLASAAFWFFALRPGRPPEHDVLRGSGEAQLQFLAPQKTLPAPPAPALFRWSAVPGAALYTFEILDDSLETVFSSAPGPETQALLPHGIRKKLAPGRSYYLKVTAWDDSPKALSSGMMKFLAE